MVLPVGFGNISMLSPLCIELISVQSILSSQHCLVNNIVQSILSSQYCPVNNIVLCHVQVQDNYEDSVSVMATNEGKMENTTHTVTVDDVFCNLH